MAFGLHKIFHPFKLNLRNRARPEKEDYIKAILNWSIFTLVYILIIILFSRSDHFFSLILLGFSLVMIVLYVSFIELTGFKNSIQTSNNRYRAWGAFTLVIWLALFTSVFGIFCMELNNVYPMGFDVPKDASLLTWIGFGFDNLLEAVLFDLLNVYNISFSNINQANFATQTLVMGFRLFIDLLILKLMINYIKKMRKLKGGYLRITRDKGSSTLVNDNKGG